MILISLEMDNFRQFYGKQRLEFARGGGDRNVTLVHGFNGAGKTTLLNAFVWCLYGRTTPDFGAPDRIESERALAEAPPGTTVTVRVRLRYVLRGDEFLVERTQAVLRTSGNEARRLDPELKMWQVVDGQLVAPPGDVYQFQQRINQMLPEGLYPFFFFNGERVEWLAKKEASPEVERGIKVFLDVEIYERSIRHLRKDVAKDLADQLKGIGGDELKHALDQETALGQAEEEAQKKIDFIAENISKIHDEVSDVEARQASIQAISDLARERDRLRKELERCERDRADVEAQITRALSDDGYLVFAGPAFASTEALIASARERGELPAKIKPQFVTDLLERMECICGRSLDPLRDQVEVARLTDWREKVGLAALEQGVSEAGAALAALKLRAEKFGSDIDLLQAKRDSIFGERRLLRDELASVLDRMGDREHGEDALMLTRRLEELRQQEIDFLADKKTAQAGLDRNREVASKLTALIKSLKVQDAKAVLVKRQREAVDRIADVLEKIYDVQKHAVREYLSAKVAEIWADAAVKPYVASVLEDFSLSLTKSVNGTVQPVHGASTGEKQVLALSFVGSLVRKAEENLAAQAGAQALGLQVGGQYPLVMDSPFGSLEDDYRAKVAHWIPTLAHQVVIFVSKTQWRDEVERETRPRVGREFILELHTQKQGADRMITIGGRQFPYVVETLDPIEQTLIREVV